MKRLALSLLLLGATVSCAHAASSTCDFSHDRLNSTPFDNQLAPQLKRELTRYRLTTKQRPALPVIYGVTVRARTAVIEVDKQNPLLPGGSVNAVPQGNDFRYAQVWQRLYDATYHTRGACVRAMLLVRGGNVQMQRCWGGEGATCGR